MTADSSTESGPLGWDALTEWFDSAGPDAFPDFIAGRNLETSFEFLYHLIGRQPRDLIARAAVLRIIQGQPTGSVAPRDLNALFGGLKPDARDAILTHLRDGGWIRYDPTRGWTVTSLGHRFYQVVLFLLKKSSEETLQDSMHMHDALDQMQGDTWASIRGLKSNLQSHLAEVSEAIGTHSPLQMEAHQGKVNQATDLSRILLKKLGPHISDPTAYPIIEELHQVNVDLGLAATELQRNLVQVLRQQITLPSGFTVEDVTRALIQRPSQQLADAMSGALQTPYVPQPYFDVTDWPDAVLSYWDRDRLTTADGWNAPPASSAVPAEGLGDNQAARRFLEFLQKLPAEKTEWDVEELLAADQGQDAGFRLALLGLLGRGGAGESLLQQFRQLGLDEDVAEGFRELTEGPIRLISRARIRRRQNA